MEVLISVRMIPTTLSVALILKSCICAANGPGKQYTYTSERGHISTGLIKLFDIGLQLCDNQCNKLEHCKPKAHYKAKLLCRKNNNISLAMVRVSRNQGQRAASVNMINKGMRHGCSSLVCSVTHVCTSLDERDCNPMQRKFTVDTLYYIAASSRHSNIIYGHGYHIESIDHMLSINLTSRDVGEHALHVKERKHNKYIIPVCGLTTGRCNKGQKACVYVCYESYAYPRQGIKLRVFEEPDVQQNKVNINFNVYDLTKGKPLSIALDMVNCIYILMVHRSKLIIRVVHLRRRGTIIKEMFTSIPLKSLDVMKSGAEMLLKTKNETFLLQTRNLPKRLYGVHLHRITQVEAMDRGYLACLRREGRYVVFVNEQFPFNVGILRLK